MEDSRGEGGGTCAWLGCTNTFRGGLPHDWIRLCAYWSAFAETENTIADVAMTPLCKRNTVLCAKHATELNRISSHRRATGWFFKVKQNAPTANRQGEERRPKPTLLCTVQSKRLGLHLFLFAHVGRSIPRTACLRAIGLGLCGGHISREGWTCEGKCEGQCKNRK